MSFVRFNRSARSQVGGKSRKKKAAPALPLKREWDSTISDLSVHRAGPEELARRRENRVSKNRAAAQWELRQQAAGGGGSSSRRRRCTERGQERAVMAEVLLDQWQLREVLTRSDRALAVVRDLFGDAPRRQAGFPNVTVAPDLEKASSAQLIAQRCDRPTQLSVLSESVMDSQALNETEDGNSYRKLSEESQEEADRSVAMDCQSNIDSNGHLQERKQPRTPERTSQSTAQRSYTSPNQSLGLKTPCTPDCASVIHTGLNATTAIKRVKSRVESRAENDTEPDGSSQSETTKIIRQVLHPSSRNSKMGISTGKNCNMPTKRMEDSRQEDRQLSLEVLQEMIENIDQEMVEYERQTGREVTGWLPQRGHSLTGFTVSLVNLISRLTHYLKENEIQQWQEKENQQQLLEKSKEQQALIDALTAEFLTIQEEVLSVQANLHQYMNKTDEELFVLKQMLHGSTEAERNKSKPRHKIDACEIRETAEEQGSLHTCAYPTKQDKVNAPILRAAPNIEEELLESLMKKQPSAYQHNGNLLEKARRGQSLPEHLFSPAVLLSPPRQRNSQVATGSQTTVKLFQESPLPNNEVYLESNYAPPSQIHKEALVSPVVLQGEKYFAEYLATQNQNQLQDHQDLAQQCKFWDTNEGHNLILTSPVTNLPQMHPVQQPGVVDDTATCVLRTMESKVEAEGSRDLSLDKWFKQEAMLSQIAELQLQNSALRAHLDQLKIGKLPNPAPLIEKTIPSTSESLQQRITELNQQSAEARGKLLNLIEQHRQVSGDFASPPISPIPPEGIWTGTSNRTLEVLIPLPNGLDSSTGTTPSPTSKINRSRSTDNASTASSSLHLDKGDGNRTPVTQRMKPERLKEGGWFALSAHTL
ncbi:spindle and centriole-associated protein 1 [Heptranchias perlo]|uniref:spindle and centriole-associated protein 1 n=1 Tax=Heptranchias perlo TaxID=212740 RepID=UPI003559E110